MQFINVTASIVADAAKMRPRTTRDSATRGATRGARVAIKASPRKRPNPARTLALPAIRAQACLVVGIDETKNLNGRGQKLSLEQLQAIAREGDLGVMGTFHVRDDVVDRALDEGRDPCSAARSWLDDTLGQHGRRCQLSLRSMIFFELAEGAEAGRQVNSRYRLHGHVLLGASTQDGQVLQPEELISILAPFCRDQSNRDEELAAQLNGWPARRPWCIGHVTQKNSGVPWHLTPIDQATINKAVSYCWENIEKNTRRLTALMRKRTTNKRQAKLVSVNRNMQEHIASKSGWI